MFSLLEKHRNESAFSSSIPMLRQSRHRENSTEYSKTTINETMKCFITNDRKKGSVLSLENLFWIESIDYKISLDFDHESSRRKTPDIEVEWRWSSVDLMKIQFDFCSVNRSIRNIRIEDECPLIRRQRVEEIFRRDSNWSTKNEQFVMNRSKQLRPVNLLNRLLNVEFLHFDLHLEFQPENDKQN